LEGAKSGVREGREEESRRCIREKDLAEDVIEKSQFDIGGEIGVNPILTQELMMLNMIFLQLHEHM
jgi:hypothetical protein